ADEVAAAVLVEGLAQAPDVDVDGARLDLGFAAPDCVQELLPREDAARPLQEHAQEPELSRAQMHGVAVPGDAVARKVHHEVGITQRLGAGGRPRAAQYPLEARPPLGDAEGLHDVVAGAPLAAADAARRPA